jgi:hypothetical protein
MRGVPRVSPVAIVTLSLRDLSAAADFSRIRNADLGRFTLDRLVSIINRLGARVMCGSGYGRLSRLEMLLLGIDGGCLSGES